MLDLLPLLLLTVASPARAALDPLDAQAILQIEARRLPAMALAPYVEHPDAETRARAARALGRLRDPAALAGLRPLLVDDDVDVRLEAAFAIGQTPGGELPAQDRFAEEPDPAVRARLVEALGKRGEADAVPTLLAALHEGGGLRPSPVPAAAAVALGRLAMRDVPAARDPAVLAALVRCLQRLHKPTRRAAAFALARSKATTLASGDRARLLQAAGDDWDPVVRALLVRAAAGLDLSADDRDSLLDTAAADLEPPVRVAAARAAAATGWTGVATLLDDDDTGVRREAITAVPQVEGLDAGALLQPFLDAGATLDAAEAQRTTGDPALVLAAAAVEALATHDLLADPDTMLATAMPTAIRTAAVPAIHDLDRLRQLALEDGETPVRTTAASLLSEATTDPDDLLPLLSAFDPMVAAVGAEYLAEHPANGSADALLQALADADEPDLIRATCSALAARFKGHPSPPLARDEALRARLDSLAAHPDAGVRAAVADLRAVLKLPELPASHGALIADIVEIGRIQGARVQTSRGEVRVELLPEEAPLTVWNFAWLADSGFYDNLVVHRVVPDFVVQDGDPRGDGWGGPGWSIPDEINPVAYDTGVLGMALSGPDTGGSQWFITLSPQPHLDGGYTVFGRVTAGMAVVDSIQPGDRIEWVRIERAEDGS